MRRMPSSLASKTGNAARISHARSTFAVEWRLRLPVLCCWTDRPVRASRRHPVGRSVPPRQLHRRRPGGRDLDQGTGARWRLSGEHHHRRRPRSRQPEPRGQVPPGGAVRLAARRDDRLHRLDASARRPLSRASRRPGPVPTLRTSSTRVIRRSARRPQERRRSSSCSVRRHSENASVAGRARSPS